MIEVLIGLLILLQPQPNLGDAAAHVPVLHDSLTVQNGEVLSLSGLNGWEFTTDTIEDSTVSVRWVRLEQPISDQDAFPDSLWNGFGYYRLKFKVDSTFTHKEAFLRFSSGPNVSAEIYLNDESVLKIGNPSRDKESEEIVARYTGMGQPVHLNPGTEYVLVVKKSYHRYSLYRALTFQTFNKPYSFSLSLASPDYVQTVVEQQKVSILINGISLAVIFILSVLYLTLYFKVKDQKENLWLVLLMVSIGGVALNGFLYQFTVHSFWLILVSDIFLQNVLTPLAILLVPLVTHKLLKVHTHIFWKAYVIVGTVAFYTKLGSGELMFPLIVFISLAGGLIAIYKASKQGVRDTIIPAVSILGLPVVLTAALVMDYFGFLGSSFSPVFLLFLYNTLPVGLSIYQGKKFLRLNTEMEDLVTERTTQLEIAYKQLEESLSDLKATQSQLVQQEKLASLGQLTAGIAHEIKNPLNFVNNFSEVSLELVEEAREEVKGQTAEGKGQKTGTTLKVDGAISENDKHHSPILDILDDIEANLRKIHEHGSRADGIVKSMLQHSRGGNGKMEPTPLNPLIKEYVNLAFHGMRAGKDPINVDIDLQLDETIGEVPLITEDFSRVILNLCNNAFDACAEQSRSLMRDKSEKEKVKSDSERSAHLLSHAAKRSAEPRSEKYLPPKSRDQDWVEGSGESEPSRGVPSELSYHPKLTVRTKSDNGKVTIEIEDNGPGIPDEIKDKILQPFFTTKKGTQGTGLGLSITNDIVKAHGGSMEIHSQPGQTVFTIKLNG